MTNSEYEQLVEFLSREFAAVDRRFTDVDRRFDAVDRRFEAVVVCSPFRLLTLGT